jgi:hypothetical protein
MEIFRPQPFEEIQNHYKERENYLVSKKVELIQRLTPIFKLIECSDYTKEGFDWFGDDDLLKLNFGGKNVDIKRSVLTKPKIGWNLFSRLFDKRWDAFHVRDNNGRIYVDSKEEWMRPLIDYMKYNKTGEDPILSKLYLFRSIQLFNESGEFKIPELQTFLINGCSISIDGTKTIPSMIFDCILQHSYWDANLSSKPDEVQVQIIYSTDFSGTKTPPKPMDLRFKTLAYIIFHFGQLYSLSSCWRKFDKRI